MTHFRPEIALISAVASAKSCAVTYFGGYFYLQGFANASKRQPRKLLNPAHPDRRIQTAFEETSQLAMSR